MDDLPAPDVWGHGRAVRYLVGRIHDGVQVVVDDDERETLFYNPANDEVLRLTDHDLDSVMWPLTWDLVDTGIMDEVVEILCGD